MRVLVVSEDATERLRATSAMRLREDVAIVEVDGAAPGREQALAGGYDVLIIDGDLYPKGGFSLLYELRADAELNASPNPPALIMLDREQDRWLAAWAGANEAMLKPVDSFRLAATVDALVGTPPAAHAAGDESADELRRVVGVEPA